MAEVELGMAVVTAGVVELAEATGDGKVAEPREVSEREEGQEAPELRLIGEMQLVPAPLDEMQKRRRRRVAEQPSAKRPRSSFDEPTPSPCPLSTLSAVQPPR